MRPIPVKLRYELGGDPFMTRCIYSELVAFGPCRGRVEWEHPWIYARQQVNERWAIVPVCTGHHRMGYGCKELNRYASLLRMTDAEMSEATVKYPREDWRRLKAWLATRWPDYVLPEARQEF